MLFAVMLAAGACTGRIGPSGGGGPSSGSAGAGSGAGGDGPGSKMGSGGAGAPFEALPVASYVTKVKTVLTGLAPTQVEIDAVAASPSALGTLVDGWMALPAYQIKMERFFADAFQQSQAQSQDFKSVIDDGIYTPSDPLLLDFRQSFAKTVTALVAAGEPFTEVATTRRYMMTTAMMVYYAYTDTSLLGDATEQGGGQLTNRFIRNDPKWSFTLTAKRTVSLADSGNPASADYLVFTVPNLSAQYGTTQNAAYCSAVDPVVFNNNSSFAYGGNLAAWLYSFLLGQNFWFFDPPQGQPGANWCEGGGTTTDAKDQSTHAAALTAADYADWRMVTIQTAPNQAAQTRFFDVVGIRAGSTLSLFAPRIGYFTTPAFFSQYPTNVSNQARVTANQTMIVGLGRGIDGTDPVPATLAPGVDAVHAGNPACMVCHSSLDPLRRFFRAALTLNYSAQLDPAQTSVPGTFVFGGVTAPGATLYDLAAQIAAHPRFKIAWTKKLCAWANSHDCEESDPELQRVAQVFADSHYDWRALVRALFTSPLVTYAAMTATAAQSGTPVAITRRAQLCATLDNRLALTDVCGLAAIQTGAGGRTIPAVAAQLPSDGYSRGQAAALYLNDPDPFFRAAVEKICALAADRVVDVAAGADAGAGGTSSLFTSAQSDTAIAGIVHGLMGLDASRDAQPIQILTDHYQSALAGGKSPTVALKSTFTLACTSPWVVSVGL
jgi:hypothetical protein